MRYCLSQWKLFLIGAGTAASIAALGTATTAEARPARSGHRVQGVTQAEVRGSSYHAVRHHRVVRAERPGRHHRYARGPHRVRQTAAQQYQEHPGYQAGYEVFQGVQATVDYRAALNRRAIRRHLSRDAMASVAPERSATMASAGYGGGSVVSEARRWIGTNPTNRRSLWCGTFMNFVLQRTGHSGTGSDLARSFAALGHRVSGPQVGAIAVMSRRGGGHVGVVSGIDGSGNPIVISGNHGHRVAESVYPRGRIYAYVVP